MPNTQECYPITGRPFLHPALEPEHRKRYYYLRELDGSDDSVNNRVYVVEHHTYDAYGNPKMYVIKVFDVTGTGNTYDGTVNAADANAISARIGQDPSLYGTILDINGDGSISNSDVTLVTNNPGVAIATSPTSAINNPYLFTGRTLDILWKPSQGVNLLTQDNRNRNYDLVHGRWLQRDPEEYVDSLSLFEYAKSSPVVNSDPVGRRIEAVRFNDFDIGPGFKFENYTVPKVGHEWQYDFKHFGERGRSAVAQLEQQIDFRIFFWDEKENLLRKYNSTIGEYFGMVQNPDNSKQSKMVSSSGDQHGLNFTDDSQWALALKVAKRHFKTCRINRVRIEGDFKLWPSFGLGGITSFYQRLANGTQSFEFWQDMDGNAKYKWNPKNGAGTQLSIDAAYATDVLYDSDYVEWKLDLTKSEYVFTSNSSGYGSTQTGSP